MPPTCPKPRCGASRKSIRHGQTPARRPPPRSRDLALPPRRSNRCRPAATSPSPSSTPDGNRRPPPDPARNRGPRATVPTPIPSTLSRPEPPASASPERRTAAPPVGPDGSNEARPALLVQRKELGDKPFQVLESRSRPGVRSRNSGRLASGTLALPPPSSAATKSPRADRSPHPPANRRPIALGFGRVQTRVRQHESDRRARDRTAARMRLRFSFSTFLASIPASAISAPPEDQQLLGRPRSVRRDAKRHARSRAPSPPPVSASVSAIFNRPV
jgi:hypothetical protein